MKSVGMLAMLCTTLGWRRSQSIPRAGAPPPSRRRVLRIRICFRKIDLTGFADLLHIFPSIRSSELKESGF